MRDKGKRTLAQGDMVSAEVIAIGIVTTILVFSLLSVVMAAGDEQHEQARRVFERQVHALHSPYTIQEDMPEDSSAASSPNGVPSFFVTQIELIDQERHGRSAWRRIAQNYEHRLLTQKDIGELVNDLQKVFREKGFITGKVVVPEQNIADGVLRLQYIPGKFRQFVHAPNSRHVWRNGTFPAKSGDELNLRDLEQGLENIRQAPGQQVQMKIVPTGQDGESDVWLAVTQGNRLYAGLTTNNYGNHASGRYRLRGELTWSAPLHKNDVLRISRAKNIDSPSRYSRYRQTDITYLLPYRKYLFSYRYSNLSTQQPIHFPDKEYPYRNQSKTQTIAIERNIYRAQTSRLTIQLSVEDYRKKAYIRNTELRIQRIHKFNIAAGMKYTTYYPNGMLNALLNVSHESYRQPAHLASPSAKTVPGIVGTVDISYLQQGKWANHSVQYRLLFHGQKRTQARYSIDELAIGGRYTVRGFTGERTLSGKDGWYMQQEWTLGNHAIKPFLGWDIGAVYHSAEPLSGHVLSGVSVGITAMFKNGYASLSCSTPIIRPHSWSGDRWVSYIEAGINF